jgi:hypothetical protein
LRVHFAIGRAASKFGHIRYALKAEVMSAS